jgi:hypothetical protein
MKTIRLLPFRTTTFALAAALLALSCGGGSATTPTPAPTPVPTPTPEPTPAPPTTSCSPLPPPVTRMPVQVRSKNREYWEIDVTPIVGHNREYCASIGFTDGRTLCPVRAEGDPMRVECETWAVGIAEDTGLPGPTWTRNGEYCTGPDSGCEHHPYNLFKVRVYTGGLIRACAENKACGEEFVDKDL